jgi:hypothetical protein
VHNENVTQQTALGANGAIGINLTQYDLIIILFLHSGLQLYFEFALIWASRNKVEL